MVVAYLEKPAKYLPGVSEKSKKNFIWDLSREPRTASGNCNDRAASSVLGFIVRHLHKVYKTRAQWNDLSVRPHVSSTQSLHGFGYSTLLKFYNNI